MTGSDKLRQICLLSYDYPPNDGGISRLAGAVVEELSRQRRLSEVVTLRRDDGKDALRPPVPTRVVPFNKLWRDLSTFRYLLGLRRGTQVLATIWNPEATLAWLAGLRRFAVMAHGNEVMPYPSGLKFALKAALRRRVLAAAGAVICNSRYTEKRVQAISPSAKTVVICPAVDADRFLGYDDQSACRRRLGLPVDKRVLLSVSRIDAYKGHDVVLKALAQLPVETRQQLHYVVAGRGSHLPQLQQLADRLGLTDCVTWLGFVDDEALPALYAAADLFLLCTREDPQSRGVEGFGMVFLEAQAAGIAVLGTAIGGIPDAIVVGEGGWLVAQDDVAAVAGHLSGLAADLERYRVQGRLGRERISRDVSWEKYVNRLRSVLEPTDV